MATTTAAPGLAVAATDPIRFLLSSAAASIPFRFVAPRFQSASLAFPAPQP